ncbi:7914_t:CDS:2, partial [Racocetra fulgida]
MVTSKKDKKLASVTMKLSENNEIIDGTPVDAREISNPAIIILGNTVAFTNLTKKQTEYPQFQEALDQEMRDLLTSVDNRCFISPNPEMYKKDSPPVLCNMKKAKALISEFRSAYTTATFNEIRDAENREAEALKAASGGCFKLDTQVILINRKVVPMSSVRVGDQ